MSKGSHFQLIVVGAGPGGMAAAVGAYDAGLRNILVVDRNDCAGGILPQCIHEGFGRDEEGRPLTGPEWVGMWKNRLEARSIPVQTMTTVLDIDFQSRPFRLRFLSRDKGAGVLTADSLVLSMGCRERTLGQMRIPGSRPAGIFTAGSAQYMMNRQNLLPGKNAVILGSGDIGLIMARRLLLEGLNVKLILGEKASGLARNHIQCVRDFGTPIRFGWTLLSTHGYKRLTGVSIAPVDEAGKVDLTKKEYIRCDTLLVAAGLIPETELFKPANVSLTDKGGIPAGAWGDTAVPGVFACGNVTRIYDLVEDVARDGLRAGSGAAAFVLGGGKETAAGDMQGISLGKEPGYEILEDLKPDELVCILCPRGCRISRSQPEKGGLCERGREYALSEIKDPRRTLTTTVKLRGTGTDVWPEKLVPARSREPIPKGIWKEAMKKIRDLSVNAPVKEGQILLENICHTGIPLVASAYADAEGEATERGEDL